MEKNQVLLLDSFQKLGTTGSSASSISKSWVQLAPQPPALATTESAILKTPKVPFRTRLSWYFQFSHTNSYCKSVILPLQAQQPLKLISTNIKTTGKQ